MFGGRALLPHEQYYKIDRRGGGPKIVGNYPFINKIKFILYYFRVRLSKFRIGQFTVRALRLGQERGPSAAARTD